MTAESITIVTVPVAYFFLSSYSLATTVAIYTAVSIVVSLASTLALYKMIVDKSKSLVRDNDYDDLDRPFKKGQ